MTTSPLFPLFADLRGRAVLVVGGGAVARRKVGGPAGGRRAGAGRRPGAGAAAGAAGRRRPHRAPGRANSTRPGSTAPGWSIAATDDDAVNRAVAAAAEARRIWANVVDDAELSSVQCPARVERGPLQIAISSGGGAPMLARHLREQLETQLDESLGALAELLAPRARPHPRAPARRIAARRRFFDRVLAGPIPGLLRRGDRAAARTRIQRRAERSRSRRRAARVALVGAGPGDPGLLTLRALRLLNEADVILHDRLVSADVLALARRDAELHRSRQAGRRRPPRHAGRASTR